MIAKKLIRFLIIQTSRLNHHTFKKLSSKFISFERDGYKVATKLSERVIEFGLELNDVKIGTKTMPFIWLRENCKCEKCFNYRTNECDLDLTSLPLDIVPREIIQDKQEHRIEIKCKHIIFNYIFRLQVRNNFKLKSKF